MIHFRVNDKHVRDMFGRFATEIPKAGIKDLEEIAKMSRKEMRRELSLRNINWTYALWKNIRIERLGRKKFAIFVPIHGVHLDSMRPHWVSIKRKAHLGIGADLTVEDWIRTKGNAAFKKAVKHKTSIYVRPKPWISNAVRRSSRLARRKAKQGESIKRVIKRKGR